MTALAVRGVTKSFGSTSVLRGVDLDVGDGEVVALLGSSGCGKTTLLRLIAGLETLDAGTIEVGGQIFSGDGVHVEADRRRIGLVFQNGSLFPHLDATRNVGFGLARSQRRGGARIDEMLALVGMSDLAARRPAELSGGQQQRVALARALAPAPDVVLMDEPFSNLDAVLRLRLRHEVREVIAAAEVTTVFVTHDREEAFAIADRVAVMHDGVVVQVDTAEKLYERPCDRWVATFVGDADFVTGTVDGATIRTIFGRLDLAGADVSSAVGGGDEVGVDGRGEVDVLVRPEHLMVRRNDPDSGTDADADADAGGGAVVGTVVAVEFSGATSLLTVRLGDGTCLRSRGLGIAPCSIGGQVTVTRRRLPAVAFAR